MFICIYSLSFYAENREKTKKRVIINRDSIFCGMRFKKKNQFKPLIKRE